MRRIDLERWRRYFELRQEGHSVQRSAQGAKIDPKTAWRFERAEPGSTGLEAARVLGITEIAGLAVGPDLHVDAKRALNDFGYFRRRYFGRVSSPWQERAAQLIAEKLETDERELGVINCPPGSGKSTLFTHDIPAWLIARRRSIRILFGHRTERFARLYVGRLKRSLERQVPMAPDPEAHARGLAFYADATLAGDYGEFKPPGREELWRGEALVVQQYGGQALDDKEPTVSAFGADSGFLGGRFDFIVWDDLVDKRNLQGEALDKLVDAWTTEYETRLDPGGLLILQGQRMSANDLYSFCLNQADLDGNPKYFHVSYPAHDEHLCTGEHDDAQPWPASCLLDPVRLPWRELSVIKANTPKVFDVQYQQGDGSSSSDLVEITWIEGGMDSTGAHRAGCQDKERRFGVSNVPAFTGWSLLSVDPSPTNFWGIGWWVMYPREHTYELVELYRRRMGSQEWLSKDMSTGEFSGLVEEIRQRSVQISHPLDTIVIEINAAQKFLLAQPHVQEWSRIHGVTLLPHITSAFNKTVSEHNVTSIADFFRQGRVRLPYGDLEGRQATNNLKRELVQWPEGQTDDLVMMTWFALRATQLSYHDPDGVAPKFSRPNFVRKNRGIPTPGEAEQLPYTVRRPVGANR